MEDNWTDIENEILEEISNFEFDLDCLDSFTKETEEEIWNNILKGEVK